MRPPAGAAPLRSKSLARLTFQDRFEKSKPLYLVGKADGRIYFYGVNADRRSAVC